jgi:murein DD-endopeptidase MepM/ murein hydrolase activator NlpD
MTVLFPKTKYDPVGGAWGLGTVSGYPCEGYVSSLFGATDMAEHDNEGGHNGTDIAADQGTPLYSPRAMTVTDVFSLDVVATDPLYIQLKEWFGNSVWFQFTDDDGVGWRTMFAHLAEPATSLVEGTEVSEGTFIGYVGSTGLSTGPHLHWTLGPESNRWLGRGNGNVEVLDYCAGDAEPVAQDNNAIIRALQDARAAIDRATALVG